MKYLKLFEIFDFDEEEWDFDEEEYQEHSYKDIPIYQEVGISYDVKDETRIRNILLRSKNREHALSLAQTMANRITHIDKAIRRGNACFIGAYPPSVKKNMSQIFYDRAKKLFFG